MAQLTSDQCIGLLKSKRCKQAEWAKLHSAALSAHADGDVSALAQLLGDTYPTEPKEVYEWRKKNLDPDTPALWNKVVSAIAKIKDAPDAGLNWSKSLEPPLVKGVGQPISDYIMYDLPYYGSVEQWVWGPAFDTLFKDPNALAVCYAKPEYVPVEVNGVVEMQPTNELPEPTLYLFRSANVVDFVEGEYAVIEQQGEPGERSKAMVIDGQMVRRYQSSDNGWALVQEWAHGCETLPVRRLGGTSYTGQPWGGKYRHTRVYSSFLAPMLNHLNKELRMASNLAAAIYHHTYPEAEQFEMAQCPDCHGSGYRNQQPDAHPDMVAVQQAAMRVTCGTCKGKGTVAVSPFQIRTRKFDPLEQTQNGLGIPFPSKAYIAKPIDVVQFQLQLVEQERRNALAAVNFEFLAESPANQSGVAKQYDRAELNAFVRRIAGHITGLYKWAVKCIAQTRYMPLLLSAGRTPEQAVAEVYAMCPEVVTPRHFDLVAPGMLADEYKNGREAGLPGYALQAKAQEWAGLAYAGSEKEAELSALCIAHDPYPGMTVAERADLALSVPEMRASILLSLNVRTAVASVLEQQPDFAALGFAAQRERLLAWVNQNYGRTALIAPFGVVGPVGSTEYAAQFQQAQAQATQQA